MNGPPLLRVSASPAVVAALSNDVRPADWAVSTMLPGITPHVGHIHAHIHGHAGIDAGRHRESSSPQANEKGRRAVMANGMSRSSRGIRYLWFSA